MELIPKAVQALREINAEKAHDILGGERLWQRRLKQLAFLPDRFESGNECQGNHARVRGTFAGGDH